MNAPEEAVQIAVSEVRAAYGLVDETVRYAVEALAHAGWVHDPARVAELEELLRLEREISMNYRRAAEHALDDLDAS